MLDTRTVMILWCAEAITLASLMALMWNSDRKLIYNLLIGLGFAAHGGGVLLVGLRGLIPDFLSIEIANTMALSSFLLWTRGLWAFDGKPDDLRGAIPALIWIAFLFVPPVREDLYSRQIVFQAASCVGFLLIARILLVGTRNVSKTRKMLAWLLIFQGFAGLIATITRPIFDSARVDPVPVPPFTAFSVTLTFIAAILLCAKMFMDKSHEKLQLLSLSDPLTGVFNRRGLTHAFTQMTLQPPPGKPKIAMLLFDLDHFKQINDRHGHQAGDSVLMHFCNIANRLPEETGIFVRMGGEEFATVMHVASIEDAAVLAETIRMDLSVRPATTESGAVPATVSIGVAAVPVEHASLDRLISQADKALYAAKVDGRDRTAIRHGDDSIIVPCASRIPDPVTMDKSADRQVAALNRMAKIARS